MANEPVGIDVVEPPILFELQKLGVKVVDGQQLMSNARMIKTQDEILLLNHSAMMVDAAYEELYRTLRPGVSENQAVGTASKVLGDTLQLDVYAAQGSSGSPVFNTQGIVVGVLFGAPAESNGRIIYAVPSSKVAAQMPGEGAGVVK